MYEYRRHFGLLFLGIFVLQMLGILGIWQGINTNANTYVVSSLSQESLVQSRSIIDKFEFYTDTIYSLRGIFAASEKVTLPEWNIFTNSLNITDRHTAIDSVAYIEVVHQNEKESFEKELSASYTSYLGKKTEIKISPEEIRESYFAVKYVSPYNDSKLPAIGYDLIDNEIRNGALVQAMETGLPTITRQVKLIFRKENENSFIMYLPIYSEYKEDMSLDQRRESITGFVAMSFQMSEMMNTILSPGSISDLSINIYDLTSEKEQGEAAMIYSKDSKGMPVTETKLNLTVLNRTWQLVIAANENYARTDAIVLMVRSIFIALVLISTVFLGYLYYTGSRDIRKTVNQKHKQ
jgi:CHASE1-domain containing sensor protein